MPNNSKNINFIIKRMSINDIIDVFYKFISEKYINDPEIKKFNYNTLYFESLIGILKKDKGIEKLHNYLDDILLDIEDILELIEQGEKEIDYNSFKDYRFFVDKLLLDYVGFLEIVDFDKKDYGFQGSKEDDGIIFIKYNNEYISIKEAKDIILYRENIPPFFPVKFKNLILDK